MQQCHDYSICKMFDNYVLYTAEKLPLCNLRRGTSANKQSVLNVALAAYSASTLLPLEANILCQKAK